VYGSIGLTTPEVVKELLEDAKKEAQQWFNKIEEKINNEVNNTSDAAHAALDEAKKTVHGITGIGITDMTAKVDSNTGNITEYHTAVKIAFGVEH
jgi:flavin-binding protein dodecin